MDHFLYGSNYEFRKTTAIAQEYLVAAVDGFAKDHSGNKFWVNFRSGEVRRATQAEWEEGMVVPPGPRVRGPFYEPKTEEGLFFSRQAVSKTWPAMADSRPARENFA